ncbi:MAG TPA: FAD binding domain-containing protein [Pirellulales bacterium]|jgi:xanthine dehydrogenase YagS FAD-binding subunit|nr:FAD binding domain-containing protein [Pirellulales bacterium]
MKAFEYAAPRSEQEVLELLSAERGHTEVMAGGTDLVGLMKKMIVTPQRVVSLKQVDSLRSIEVDSEGLRVGAMATLEDLLDHPASEDYPAVRQAIRAIGSLQLQAQGTLGGELCQRPRCWYFRDGKGLLARAGKAVEEGDNRYHAIFGNAGPAKFVCPSRLAPALIALNAKVRMIGPELGNETLLPLALFFRTPADERQRENELLPNQIVAQVLLPRPDGRLSASYEVQHGSGPDYPLVAAAASLGMRGGVVAEARIVLGQVAPTPWISTEAADSIVGMPVTYETAEAAGYAAHLTATPLTHNEYKVQLAKVAVKRAILLAAGLETGGF